MHPVRYVSTRDVAREPERRRFTEILLEGLAPDGGLYLPDRYPQLDAALLASWRDLPYAELAHQVLALFVDDIPDDDLRRITMQTYSAEVFGTAEIAPLTSLNGLREGVWLQELSNGPTLAFKDMAMQLLGGLFEYELARRGEALNILGATSGDTGSAAEYAMRGRDGISVFMLSPHGRMSPFQQAQMFTLDDANIHNLSVRGVFDDCQDVVKAVSADLDFKRHYRIGTVNSINWARLLAQVVYYISGWLQATTNPDDEVSFAVPTGNFGNICAGHIARQMGLPIRRLVLATNENNVLEEFFRTGTYRVRSAADTYETSSPSMDISKASNFERFVFDLLGRDAARTAQLFGTEVGQGGFTLNANEFAQVSGYGFSVGMSTHTDRLETMKTVYAQAGRLIDTHTADGVRVALDHLEDGVPMIVLETAQPVKFSDVVTEATGITPTVPPAVAQLASLPRHVTVMDPDVEDIKAYLSKHALS